ncbi:hypothetical protein CLF_103954 [Clonorchis sinensis]|uniref:Uncharacterized protein n=1 Tax=Clonorchis sinensis TaxID=79923 RepID=G7YAQ2_CLOSI|nr:hypothetical protein CLF_103954 [Clonorchis sinensis]
MICDASDKTGQTSNYTQGAERPKTEGYRNQPVVVQGKHDMGRKRDPSIADSRIDLIGHTTIGNNATLNVHITLHNFVCLSLDSLEDALTQYMKENYVVFERSSSNRSTNAVLRYEWVYYKCSRRPPRPTKSQGDPKKLLSKFLYYRLPVNRRLTEDELGSCRALLKYGTPSCELRQFVADEFGKILTTQDIYNYRRKCRPALLSSSAEFGRPLRSMQHIHIRWCLLTLKTVYGFELVEEATRNCGRKPGSSNLGENSSGKKELVPETGPDEKFARTGDYRLDWAGSCGQDSKEDSCESAITLGMTVPYHHCTDMLRLIDSPITVVKVAAIGEWIRSSVAAGSGGCRMVQNGEELRLRFGLVTNKHHYYFRLCECRVHTKGFWSVHSKIPAPSPIEDESDVYTLYIGKVFVRYLKTGVRKTLVRLLPPQPTVALGLQPAEKSVPLTIAPKPPPTALDGLLKQLNRSKSATDGLPSVVEDTAPQPTWRSRDTDLSFECSVTGRLVLVTTGVQRVVHHITSIVVLVNPACCDKMLLRPATKMSPRKDNLLSVLTPRSGQKAQRYACYPVRKEFLMMLTWIEAQNPSIVYPGRLCVSVFSGQSCNYPTTV